LAGLFERSVLNRSVFNEMSLHDKHSAPLPGVNQKNALPQGRALITALFAFFYQPLDPWHPGVPQVLVVALKFSVLTTLFTPLACVAAFTAVVL